MVTDDDAYEALRQSFGNASPVPPYQVVVEDRAIAELVSRGASEAEARELALRALEAHGGYVETLDLGHGDTGEVWYLPVPEQFST